MRINKYEDLGCKEDLRQLLHLGMEMKKHFILQNEIQKARGKAVVAQEFDQKLRVAERLLNKVKALRNHIRQNGPSMPMDIETIQENTIDLTQNSSSRQFSIAEKKQQEKETMERKQMDSANPPKKQTSQANINTTNATSSKGNWVMVVAIAIILLLIFFHKFIISFILSVLVVGFPIVVFVAFLWFCWWAIKNT